MSSLAWVTAANALQAVRDYERPVGQVVTRKPPARKTTLGQAGRLAPSPTVCISCASGSDSPKTGQDPGGWDRKLFIEHSKIMQPNCLHPTLYDIVRTGIPSGLWRNSKFFSDISANGSTSTGPAYISSFVS
jgi:hypothetical protein